MGNPPLSSDEIRATAETYRELGPEYHDAVVESFLSRIDKEISNRIDAQLGRNLQATQHQSASAGPSRQRAILVGVVTGSVIAGIVPSIAYLADYPPYRLIDVTWIMIAVICISCGIMLLPRARSPIARRGSL